MKMGLWIVGIITLIASISICAQEVPVAVPAMSKMEIAGVIATALLLVSECLPFIKKFEANGIGHAIFMILRAIAKKD